MLIKKKRLKNSKRILSPRVQFLEPIHSLTAFTVSHQSVLPLKGEKNDAKIKNETIRLVAAIAHKLRYPILEQI